MNYIFTINKNEYISNINNNIFSTNVSILVNNTSIKIILFKNNICVQTIDLNVLDIKENEIIKYIILQDSSLNLNMEKRTCDLEDSIKMIYSEKNMYIKLWHNSKENTISKCSAIILYKNNNTVYVNICYPCYIDSDSKNYTLDIVDTDQIKYFNNKAKSIMLNNYDSEKMRVYSTQETYYALVKLIETMQKQIDIQTKLLFSLINNSNSNLEIAKNILQDNVEEYTKINNILNDNSLDKDKLLLEIEDDYKLQKLLNSSVYNIDISKFDVMEN